jgi:bacillithiol biosynthesis cysteine-adding enzyme BshC
MFESTQPHGESGLSIFVTLSTNGVYMNFILQDKLPGISKLARAYTKGDAILRSQFEEAQGLAPSIQERARATELIRESMSELAMTPEQDAALIQLKDGAACIVTGQQIGFLGGPMYTLYKIATMISRVRHHSHAGTPAVGVFWIEDNDHDLTEAGTAVLFRKGHGTYEASASNYSNCQPRQSAASCAFDERVESLCDVLFGDLGEPDSSTISDLRRIVSDIYAPGRLWSDAFILLLQQWFGHHGVLFLKASAVRKCGFAAKIIQRDVVQPGLFADRVQESTRALRENGYGEQIQAGDFNAFYHDDNDCRHKLRLSDDKSICHVSDSITLSVSQLPAFVREHADRFSPSVVLRPVIQDALLGSVEYIAGPGEISYLAQLPLVYKELHVNMPSIISRSGATLLSASTSKLLSKESKEVEYFFVPWEEIYMNLGPAQGEQQLNSLVERLQAESSLTLQQLAGDVADFDKSLVGAIGSLSKGIQNEISTFEKKVRAAGRRKHEDRARRLKEIHEFIFPQEKLQERVLVPISLMDIGGVDSLSAVIHTLESHPAGHHFVLPLQIPSNSSVNV